jgi:hypothetical protein
MRIKVLIKDDAGSWAKKEEIESMRSAFEHRDLRDALR